MQTEHTGLKRHLKVRHIRLMALGSTIGVGLFLGSASAIQIAGPSILLAYLLAGIVAFIVLRTLGEMAVHEPVAGSFAAYANTYVGPLAGYMVGWGYWTYWIVVGIAEVTAVGIYMTIWFPEIPQWIWALSSIVMMGFINLIAVKVFGEFEFWFALIKVVAIVAMIALGGAVIFFGFTNDWQPLGFDNLWLHGGFFPNGFTGMLLSLQMVLFAYVGIEMIGLSAGEAENPQKTIPMAIDSLAWRILIFYMGAILVILAIFPWNEVGQHGSPFVVMFERIGLREAAGVINFVVITAALSSCNAGIFSGGRLLYALSVNGYAPAPFAKLSKYGVPHRAVMTTVAICMTGVVLNYFVPDKAFQYMMAAVTFVGLMVWIAILFTQMKFRHSLTGEQVAQLGYRAPWWPYSSWFALAFIFLVVVMMGFHEDARIALILGPCLLGVYLAMFYIVGLHRKTKLNR
ncbi:amino acid permease [Polynucleobacter sphagniphilus]|uniref:AAT family amino acid transporter n=1 Tax=Polynucleobacter sphagniphilus TaxID=1743169 RepID=A0AA43MBB5_9BURK|nr:AAT family amino acid transporter [Polynucleobacter sphagniphilus]MDH6154789.1 AAT family amino acid transporter [Polynucleobacter sphagniphilus]MDH6241245.1 AAT family amino acid transporter [Polynucleobacter sphagniphilus]MDH6248698.1 AAT family amino acid transporter [Polynucleobacter sphagniphilus]MDH6300660.1 AAT family amino acid transporter [Polynucleobacter sphagniphilus]